MANDILKKRKVVVLGERSVGKSSLVVQFVENNFVDSYYPTIENNSTKSINYDGVEYNCDIIDTAGQDESAILPSRHAVNIHGFVIVYSVTSPRSFEAAKVIHDKIASYRGPGVRIPCVIVGSKVDLPQRLGAPKVPTADGEEFAKSIDASFVETSAKENVNVAKVFDLVLSEVEKNSPTKKGATEQPKSCIVM